MTTRQLLLGLLLVLHPTAARSQSVPVPENYCLPQTEAALEVPLGATRADLAKAFGAPLRHARRAGRDADGPYQITQLGYPHLDADIGRDDRIERLATGDSAVATPSGVRVGQSLPQMMPRLGLPASATLSSRTWSPEFCQRGPLIPGHAHITFTFDSTAKPGGPRLVRIEMRQGGS
ncbi:MAG TPA: hypothetical protein VMG41_02150 [Gemmatimonadales bacterium]|nr:hypothetical protein [Gemmatimonadales bacterium]